MNILHFTACAALAATACSCSKSTDESATPKPAAEKAAAATPLEKAKALLGRLADSMGKAVTALEGVTDKASAEKAATVITGIAAELRTLSPEAQTIKDSLPEAEAKEMETAAMTTMKPHMGRMTEVMQKVMANEEAAAVLGPVMNDFSQAMSPPKKKAAE